MLGRLPGFAYGVMCYGVFLATFVYAIGFVGDFGVPKTIDSEPTTHWGLALLVDALLLALFAVQHSVMARPAFKRWWTQFVPPALERSTYVLFSSLVLILLFAWWQPLGVTIWDTADPAARQALHFVAASGWLLVLASTFLINHFDLFGLRQAWLHLLGRPYQALKFTTPGPYRHVRHPLYVGWLLAFWATPTMTAAHLLFAGLTTAYILVAIQMEERDLMDLHPEYAEYRERVPMLVPRLRRTEGGPYPSPGEAA